MKKNQLRTNGIGILFSLTTLLFLPLISNAQVKVLSGGNVGIGTSSPDIWGAGTAYKTLSILGPNTSAGSCGIIELATQSTDADANKAGTINFIASANASGKRSIAQIYSFTQGSTATNRGGYLAFSTKPDNYTSDVERMRITSTGNVGIGTSTPGGTLQLLNTTHTNPNTIYSSLFAGTASILFRANSADGHFFANSYYNSSNTHIYASNGGASYIGFNYPTAGTMGFFTAPSGTAGNPVTYTNRMTILQAGNVGIGTTTPGAYLLYVNGTSCFNNNLTINGTGTINGNPITSDQMFKTNIDSIPNALSLINQLKPRSYYFDTTNIYGMNFNNQKQYGLIAQDVEQILPELVTSTTKPADVDTLGNVIHPAVTYKALNYNAFTAIMLQGIKEQSCKIDSLSEGLNAEKEKTNNQDSIIASLQTQLNALAALINSCCNGHHDNGNHNGHRETVGFQTNIELNDAQTIVLNQNVPNPFAEQTSINYSLPDNTLKAQMLFYNAQGKLIQSTELTQKGKGILNVFASDLSSGIYTYTLVVDGVIIESKKMVKQ